MKRSFVSTKSFRALVVLSALALLVFSSFPPGMIRGAFAQTTVSEVEPNDNVEQAQDLGTLKSGDVVVVNGTAGSDDPGTFVEELEADCELGSDMEDFYKFSIEQRTNVRVQLNFSGNLDYDVWLFRTTEDTDLYPEGIKLVRASAGPAGRQEDIAPMMIEAGTYYITADAFDDPGVPAGTAYRLTISVGSPPNTSELHFLDDVFCVASAVTGVNNALVVNQFEPTKFSAQLNLITAFFFRLEGRPSPANRRLRVIAFGDPSGGETPPANPTLAFDRTVTIAPSGEANGIVSLSISGGPQFTQGKVYAGFELPATADRDGLSITVGRSIFGDKTFISRDGGATWQPAGFVNPDTGETFTARIRTQYAFPQ